jgi:ketosteroid isomerase-like protein
MNQTIETLRSAYAAFNRGDMDAAVASLDPNIEWVEPVEFPGGGARQGREAVKQYLTQSRAGWAEGSSEPEGFVISNDKVVVFVHAGFRLKNTDTWQVIRLADVYTVQDNKIVAMHAFVDRKEALRWAEKTDQHYKEAS